MIARPDYRKILQESFTVDFPSIGAQGNTTNSSFVIPGAKIGDPVILGLPAAPTAGIIFSAWVSAANTISIRAQNYTAGAIDPASLTFTIQIPQIY